MLWQTVIGHPGRRHFRERITFLKTRNHIDYPFHMDRHIFDAILSARAGLKTADSRGEVEKEKAKVMDKATHSFLSKLSKLPGNNECADCTARFPGWAALPHGVFLCINCAQIHRHIGRHISQVKSISSGTYLWHEDEVAVMKAAGNVNVSMLLGSPPKPAASRSTEDALLFAKAKYEEKRWATKSPPTESGPPTAPKVTNLTTSSAALPAPGPISDIEPFDFFSSFSGAQLSTDSHVEPGSVRSQTPAPSPAPPRLPTAEGRHAPHETPAFPSRDRLDVIYERKVEGILALFELQKPHVDSQQLPTASTISVGGRNGGGFFNSFGV
jgi:hypothetical protein